MPVLFHYIKGLWSSIVAYRSKCFSAEAGVVIRKLYHVSVCDGRRSSASCLLSYICLSTASATALDLRARCWWTS